MTTPQLYSASSDYSLALRTSIDAAKQRILLETMVLDHNGEMAMILAACLRACKRGVHVVVVYDIYSHKELSVRYGLRANRVLKHLLHELEREGAVIHRVGASQVNPFAGRHHAKAVIVDDCAYIGGGVNLTGDSFKTRDFMLRFDDPTLAQTLFEALPRAALEREGDHIVYSDGSMEVLLDAGSRGESLIYDRLCQLAQQATRVWCISRFAPDGKLVRLLQQKDTQYWYNSLTSADPFGKLAIFIDQMKVKVTNNYKGAAFLHAKFCVFQLPDGHYEAISGSHNFNSRGVTFGTQELAIHTKDQVLCAQLIDFAASLSDK
jgi:phosphatidylserine/phosphatidylglycerophosphate/cardiolipin synthase-like enzyme